jgi:hypothetical protein
VAWYVEHGEVPTPNDLGVPDVISKATLEALYRVLIRMPDQIGTHKTFNDPTQLGATRRRQIGIFDEYAWLMQGGKPRPDDARITRTRAQSRIVRPDEAVQPMHRGARAERWAREMALRKSEDEAARELETEAKRQLTVRTGFEEWRSGERDRARPASDALPPQRVDEPVETVWKTTDVRPQQSDRVQAMYNRSTSKFQQQFSAPLLPEGGQLDTNIPLQVDVWLHELRMAPETVPIR